MPSIKKRQPRSCLLPCQKKNRKHWRDCWKSCFMTGTDGIMETERDITAVIIMKDTERVTAADVTVRENPITIMETVRTARMLNKRMNIKVGASV